LRKYGGAFLLDFISAAIVSFLGKRF